MKAKCTGCGRIADSDHPEELGFSKLPFFMEYQPKCKCGFYEVAHTPKATYQITDHEYEPVNEGMATFYCGCRGWE